MNAEPLTLLAAFLAGFLGSGHCLGMCGPIALLPSALEARRTGWSGVLLYNLARLASYAVLGALAGALGAGIGEWLDVPHWSLILRLVTGAVVVLVGLNLLLGASRLAFLERLGAGLWRRISPLVLRLGHLRGHARLGLLGLFWGLIPCGLVYSLLLAASVSGSAVGGAALMLAFGAGTLPAMAGLGFAGRPALERLRQPRVRRWAGAALIIGGLWLAAMPLSHVLPGGAEGHVGHGHQAVVPPRGLQSASSA